MHNSCSDLDAHAAQLADELNHRSEMAPWEIAMRWPDFDARATAHYARSVIVLSNAHKRVVVRLLHDRWTVATDLIAR